MKKYLTIILVLTLIILPQYKISAETLEELKEKYPTEENKIKGQPYINPEWIKWNELSEEEKATWHVIPEQLIVDYVYDPQPITYSNVFDTLTETYASNLPYYNLKDDGYVSPVKNQNILGLCWAFASIGALESNALINGKNLIFSERQIDYALANPEEAIIEGYNPYGKTSQELGTGGIFEYSTDLFITGVSPQLTSIWGDYTTTKEKKSLKKVLDLDNVSYSVTQTVSFPRINPETATQEELNAYNNMLKAHILKYGGVYVSSSYSPTTSAGTCYEADYKMIHHTSTCVSQRYSGHAMLVIGWDDTYGPDYNGDGVGDGAWILKNSWGATSSVAYPYLSYYSISTSFYGIVSFTERDWDNNYDQYADLLVNNDNSFTYYKNSSNAEILKRISFENQYSGNVIYNVYLSSEKNGDEILVGTVNTNNPGVYSLDIDDYELTSDQFTVSIESPTQDIEVPALSAFTKNKSNSEDVYAHTQIIDNYVQQNPHTSTTFDIYTTTNMIETGEQLNYKIYDSNNTEITDYFTFSNKYVINNNVLSEVNFINENIGHGIYLIETYYNNELLDSYEFEIGPIRVTELTTEENRIKVLLGKTNSISVTPSPSNAVNKTLSWSSVDEEIATVDDNGIITGNKIGTTYILVSTTDGSNITKKILVDVVETLEGEGTESNPYKIYTTDDFDNIRLDPSAHYELKNDIVFTDEEFEVGGNFYRKGKGWKPIENFQGTLNGSGFSIKNLKIFNIETSGGIFKKTFDATIKDLIIENSQISVSPSYTSDKRYLGILIGEGQKTILENITVTDSIIENPTSTSSQIASLAGNLYNSDVINCASLSNNIYANYYSAGLIGYTYNTVIISSYSQNNLTGVVMGGLINSSNNSIVVDSYSLDTFNGDYISSSSRVGGIAATSSSSYYKNVLAINSYGFSNDISYQIGGILGYASGTTKIINYFHTDIGDYNLNNNNGSYGLLINSSTSEITNELPIDYVKGAKDENGNLLICEYFNCNSIWEKKEDNEYITLKMNDYQEEETIYLEVGTKKEVDIYPFDELSDYTTKTSLNDGSSEENGIITGNSVGNNTITYTLNKGAKKISKTLNIIVYENKIESLELSKNSLILNEGQTSQIEYTIKPASATIKTLEWTSDNPLVATVSSTGEITAVANGFTNIRVKTTDGSNIEKIIAVSVFNFDIKTETYEIDKDNNIDKVKDNMLYDLFIKDFTVNPNIDIEVYKNEDKIDYTKPIGTGSIMKTYLNNNLIKEYSLIISGDLNGDGKVLANDILKIKRHILKTEMIEGIYLKAGDIDGNSLVNATDILYLRKYILKKSNNVWNK